MILIYTLPVWQVAGPIVVVVVVAAVVVVAVLFVEWLVATADTAVCQVLACSAVLQLGNVLLLVGMLL